MIEICIGNEHTLDGRPAPGVWSERSKVLDLRAQIRRGIDQEPALAIGADGHARLGASGDCARARSLAVRTRAIPLRQSPPAAVPSSRTRMRFLLSNAAAHAAQIAPA